jgi:hypothetical protein
MTMSLQCGDSAYPIYLFPAPCTSAYRLGRELSVRGHRDTIVGLPYPPFMGHIASKANQQRP